MDKKLRKKQCREEVRKRLESLPKEYHEAVSYTHLTLPTKLEV